MKLCYIHNIRMPGPEANTVNVAKMCSAFAELGCEVTLIALGDAHDGQFAERIRRHYDLRVAFPVASLPQIAARPAMAAISGTLMARRLGADIVYTRTPHVALAACMNSIATVLEIHTDMDGFSHLGRSALALACKNAHLRRLIVISEALARRLNQRLPDTNGRVTVAHDGADPAPSRDAFPRTPRFSAGFVGRFYPGKGLELIYRLAPLCPWADFHIVGGDAADAMRVVSAAPPSNLIFHGPQPHASVAELMAQWDVMLAPYQNSVIVADGKTDAAQWMSPLKLFEYMAAGKAILCSDLPVLREVLTDGHTAMLLPPDNPKAWAHALTRLSADNALRQQLAKHAQSHFLTRYTWRERARAILEEIR